jgi:hypothetical protein
MELLHEFNEQRITIKRASHTPRSFRRRQFLDRSRDAL